MVEESKPPGGKVTLRRELIERGGSHEVRYGGGHGSRTPSVANSALKPASLAPARGPRPLARFADSRHPTKRAHPLRNSLSGVQIPCGGTLVEGSRSAHRWYPA